MKRSKRVIVGIMAAMAIMATAACGNKQVETEEDKYEYVASTNLIKFNKAEGDTSTSMSQLIDMTKDGMNYLEVVYDDSYKMVKTYLHKDSFNSEGNSVIEIKIPSESLELENYYTEGAFLDKEGNFVLLNYQYGETDEKTFIEIYDKDGNYKFSTDFSQAIDELGLQYISNKIMGEDGNFYLAGDNGIGCVSPEGKVLFKISVDGWVDKIFKGGDGNMYASYYDYSNQSSGYCLKKIDLESKSLQDTKLVSDSVNSRNWYACTESTMFSSSETKTSIVDLNTGEETPLWSWIDIDYINTYPEAAWANEDGSYGFAIRNYDLANVEQMEIVTVKKELITPENKREKIVFGVRSYVSDSTLKAIQKFNKTNGKYKVSIKNYYEDYGYENADAMLKADISASKVDFIVSDMVDTDLIAKKAFEDLSSYMANDPNFKEEDMFSNIIDAVKINGKVYYISPTFSIISMVGNADKVGKGETWTIDEFVKLREDNPNSGFMTYATNSNALSYLLYYGSDEFLSSAEGKCDFNNDKFKRILEICKTFPDEINYEDYDDWELISNGEVFLSVIYLSDFDSMTIYDKLFKDNANIIGFPSSTGSGHKISFNSSFSICSNSKKKDGAWAFISSLFSDEQTENLDYYNGFPIKRKAYDAVIANRVNSSGGGAVGNGHTEIELTAPTQESIDRVKKIVESANSAIILDEKVFDIISEEVEPYFKDSKSVDETADSIQKRVSLYLSERN